MKTHTQRTGVWCAVNCIRILSSLSSFIVVCVQNFRPLLERMNCRKKDAENEIQIISMDLNGHNVFSLGKLERKFTKTLHSLWKPQNVI
jgi:hypothetical protein